MNDPPSLFPIPPPLPTPPHHWNMSGIVGLLNVLTNVFYLGTAYITFVRRLYTIFSWFIAVFVASSIYHMCAGIGVCFGAELAVLRRVDHIMANIAITRAFLLIANYDLLKRDDMNRYRPENTSAFHSRATPHSDNDVLLKTRYADLVAALYTAVAIYASLAFFDTFAEHMIVVGTGVAILLVTYVVHWKVKVHSIRHRFSWKAMGLAFMFSSISVFLFIADLPPTIQTHPLWHVTSATASVFLVYGSTQHMRVFSAIELLQRFA